MVSVFSYSLTAHSSMHFCLSSGLVRNFVIDVFSTRENTSICCAAVEMDVISLWNPASDINLMVKFNIKQSGYSSANR